MRKENRYYIIATTETGRPLVGKRMSGKNREEAILNFEFNLFFNLLDIPVWSYIITDERES